MTDQQKDTQALWENMPFEGMMQKMIEQMGDRCGCADNMPQMMAMCCAIQEKSKTENSSEKAA